MKIVVFSTKPYDQRFFTAENKAHKHELVFLEPHLDPKTAQLAKGAPAVCVFVNDVLDAETLQLLADGGCRIIALRCSGYNNVDLKMAAKLGMKIVRVPAYSPHAVAEHAVALILALNRKVHRAYNRVRENNFSLEGLLGFDLYGCTVGCIGTGRIGAVFCQILRGFGCDIVALDPYENPDCVAAGVRYVDLPELLSTSDIISLHCPLTPESHHLIDGSAIGQMKTGAMLINTSRGALVDTAALIQGLKSGRVGAVGLDVYEEEADLFFEDLSDTIIQDDVFARLMTFPNVIVTGHQAFFTDKALQNIAATTLSNVSCLERGEACPNEVAFSP